MWIVLIPAYGPDSVKPRMHGQGDLVIGRGNDCGMQILAPDMSRQHCRLRVEGGLVTVCDLESRNGTVVNGQRVCGEHALANGDVLGLGSTLLVVELRPDGVRQEAANEALPGPAGREAAFRDSRA